MDAMTTGDALMLRALTVGVTDCGSPRLRTFCSIVACVSLTFVPNENWATMSATEFADVERSDARCATLCMDRSIGLATCSATSAAPAPGNGATTVMTGKSMSGRSSCFSEPQAMIPPTNRAIARSSVTLRCVTASWERRLTCSPPWAAIEPPGSALEVLL
jgi:hypothetical protein